ncbi:DUF1653 domain-containing protein [Chitinivorax sp. B]|uniref:DUF1653 domain-containing protein n=1 Tax=Chitinivorax sp. B TaxID=2502235 RepID=UPI0010F9497F|nr:DUF1653 domain-containing protein [Chitinivorax sp. B]
MSINTPFYRHIDGGLYRFITHARHADDAGEVIVYEHLWPFEPGIWVRKADEFMSRFTPIQEADVNIAMQGDRQQAQQAVNIAKTARRAAKH